MAGLLAALARDVAERGDHPFVLHAGRRVTYRELDALANRAAHALRALGVEKGDRVTLALGNSVEYLVAAFGILKAGAVLNPVNPALGAREIGYILAHAEPKVIVSEAPGFPGAMTPARLLDAAATHPAGPPAVTLGPD